VSYLGGKKRWRKRDSISLLHCYC